MSANLLNQNMDSCKSGNRCPYTGQIIEDENIESESPPKKKQTKKEKKAEIRKEFEESKKSENRKEYENLYFKFFTKDCPPCTFSSLHSLDKSDK